MKKFLSLVGIVCVLAVLVGALSGVTFAADPVAVAEKADGSTVDLMSVSEFKSAVTNTDYVKVTLKQDVRITGSNNYLTIKHSMTLDLGGHVFEQTSQSNAVNVSGGSSSSLLQNVHVTITNGTIVTGQFGVYTRYMEQATCSITVTDMTIVSGTANRSGTDPAVGIAGTPGPEIVVSNSTLACVNPNSAGVISNAGSNYSLGENVHIYSTSALVSNSKGGTPVVTAASGQLYEIDTTKTASLTVDNTTYTGLNYWTTVTPAEPIPEYVAKAYTDANDTTGTELADAAALQTAVSSGDYYKVEVVKDVVLSASLAPIAPITIDLGGNTLLFEGESKHVVSINTQTIDGAVTVKNGTILAGGYGVYLRNSTADVVLDGLTVVGGRTKRADAAGSPAVGSATGGTYNVTVSNTVAVSMDDYAALNQGNNTTINWTLGENVAMYSNVPTTITGNLAEGAAYVSGLKAPGVDSLGELYSWSSNAADEKAGDPWAWVCNATGATQKYPLADKNDLDAATAGTVTAEYIKFAQDVSTSGNWDVYGSVVIDLNTRTYTTDGSGLRLYGNGDVTVKNGTIKAAMYPVYANGTSSAKATVNITVENMTLECTIYNDRTDPAVGLAAGNATADCTLLVKDSVLIAPKEHPIETKAGQTVTLEGDMKLYGLGEDYVSVREGVTVTAPMIKPVSSDIAGVNKWIPFNVFINASAALYMDDPWGYQITVNPVDADDIPLSESDQFVEDLKLYWIAGGNMPTVEYMLANGTVVDFEGSDTANILGQVKVAELNETMNMVIEYTFEGVTEYYSMSVKAADILDASAELDPTNADVYAALKALFEAFSAYETEVGDRTALEVTKATDTAFNYFTGTSVAGDVKTYAAAYLMEPWGIRFSTETVEGATAYGVVVGTGVYSNAENLLESEASVYVAEAAGTRAYVAYNGVSTLAMKNELSVVSFVETEAGVTYGKMYTISVMDLLDYLYNNNLYTSDAQKDVYATMMAYVNAFAAHNS